jgi:hypothetical protein
MIIPVQRRNELLGAITQMQKRHEEEMQAAKRDAEQAQEMVRKIVAVADPERIQRGEQVIVVRGRERLYGEWERVVDAAVSDLLAGAVVLRHSFFATKDYDRWSGQFVGDTAYGMGPRHGNIVFEVALTAELRTRNGHEARELSREEITDAVYVLERLRLEGREQQQRTRRYA